MYVNLSPCNLIPLTLTLTSWLVIFPHHHYFILWFMVKQDSSKNEKYLKSFLYENEEGWRWKTKQRLSWYVLLDEWIDSVSRVLAMWDESHKWKLKENEDWLGVTADSTTSSRPSVCCFGYVMSELTRWVKLAECVLFWEVWIRVAQLHQQGVNELH